MKKKLFLIILCIVLLPGCWDRKELNSIGIVLAVGLDKDNKTNKTLFTAQLVRPQALQKQSGTQEPPVELITAEGDTVFEAVRNMSMQIDRKAFFAHTKIILINEDIAQEHILPIIDFFRRDHEIRNSVWLMIAKGTTTREILGVKHGIENIQATYLEDIIKMRRFNSKVTAINLLQFFDKMSGEGIQPVVGVMEIIEQPNFPTEQKEGDTTKGVKITGSAVFKKDQLIGYLDEIETRGLNWVTGKVKEGIINVPSLTKGKLISIEIKRASSSIKPEIIDGKISFIIEVKEEGDIGEQQGITDVSKVEIFEKIEKEHELAIEKEIKMAVDKVQKKFRSDIFGFGNALYKKYPKKWEKIKDNWEELFPEVEYVVKVDAQLRTTGLVSKPVKPTE